MIFVFKCALDNWREAWERGQTPWDAGQSPPILKKLVESNSLPEGKALVPGCGSGYDVVTLASPNRTVIGMDLAPGAVEAFQSLREDTNTPEHQATVIHDDFFERDFDEKFDLIWDYTFLCAIEPERRKEWAKRCHELLKPTGELVTLIFPVKDRDRPISHDEQGPPYRLTPSYVENIVEPHFNQKLLEPVETSIGPRQGHEWLARWTPK